MKRSALASAGLKLAKSALLAAAIAMSFEAYGQAPRPNIAETLPPVAGHTSYAQDLVNRTVARHPELLHLDIHAMAPGTPASVIVASRDPARVGKPSDPDDLEVFKTGTPRVEINRASDNNAEVEVQLQDVTGQPVGSVELTFPYTPGTDTDALVKQGEGIAGGLRRRIAAGAEDLVAPAQFDPTVPVDTYAQYLVDDTLEKQPALVIVSLHVKDRQRDDYPILASNIGRIGKPADVDDLEVIRTGNERQSVSADGRRLEIKLPLQDAAGQVVGAVATVFPARGIGDASAYVQQAHKIRDQLRARIASIAALYGPYSVTLPAQVVQTEYDKPELGNTQSLPMTKAVVSGQALEQASQEGYAEAVRNVAGVSPANSKGSANDSINIRGIKLNLFSNYRLNGGLPLTGVITVPTEDKERVETLKGANALMFGVASPAGIINLVTKRAGDIDVTSVAAAGNSFGQYGGSVDVGRRFGVERQFGIRVNASGTHLENGVVGGHGKFISAGLDFRVTDRLSLQADYEYYAKNVVQQAGVSLLAPVNGVVPITPIPDPRKLLSGPWSILDAHTENKQIRADYVINDAWKVLAEVGRSDSDRSNFTTRIGNYNIVTGAGGVVTVNTADQEYQNTFARVEALGRFSTWFLHHDLTVGVSKTERDANNLAQNQVVLTQRQNIFDPIELAAPVFTKAPTSQLQSSKDTGVYGYDTIGIGPNWKVLLGLRRTKDIEEATGKSNTSTVTSPAYGVLYDVIPSVTLFASYMEGLEAGGTAPATAVNVNEILPSAISKQKEIGIRDSHIKGITFSSSFFEITRANAVIDPVTRIFANSGDIDYKGIEATLSWQFLPRWTVTAGGQLLKAKQVSPDPTFNAFWPENTPKAVGNVSLAYRPLWVPGLTVTGGVSGISSRFVNNQEQATIPGYALYSAGLGYVTRIAQKRVAFQLNVDNLANLRYWNSVQTGTYGTGMDRSIKFNARVDF